MEAPSGLKKLSISYRGFIMNITFNIYYKSENGNAKRFANEMIKNGIVDEIKSKNGNSFR